MPKHICYHAPGGGSLHALTLDRDANYEQAMNEAGVLWRVTELDDADLPSTLLFYHHLDPTIPEEAAKLALQHLAPPNLHLHHMNGGTIVPMGAQAQLGGGIAGQVATRAEVDALRAAIAELMSGQKSLLAELASARKAAATPPPPATGGSG